MDCKLKTLSICNAKCAILIIIMIQDYAKTFIFKYFWQMKQYYYYIK